MNIAKAPLKGLHIITPKIHEDSRGYFFESFRSNFFKSNSIPTEFVQENQSLSTKGTLRGLHYQLNFPQGKLVWVVKGCVIDIAVDIRKNSPTFGRSFCITLDDKKHVRFYIPPGFAHGFCSLDKENYVVYNCTNYRNKLSELGIMYNDKELNIKWPVKKPILSKKDKKNLSLNQYINKKK